MTEAEYNDHQSALDRLVASAHARQQVRRADVQCLEDALGGDVYGATEHWTVGVRLACLEAWCRDSELAACEGIDEKEITNAHRIAFARERLVQECQDYDADTSPGFRVKEITGSDGRTAWVVYTITGYSFSGTDIEFYGVFPTLEALDARLEADGYVQAETVGTVEDTVAWANDQKILKYWQKD